jgi:branched-chain amino acid transport system substrate-binding protein
MTEEDVLPAQGDSANGIRTALHWSYVLDNAENTAFKEAYLARTGNPANVFAVQGYDTARVVKDMLDAVEGDTSDVEAMIGALGGVSFDSPRGLFRLDANSQSPEHNMYLREVQTIDGELHNAILETLGLTVDPGDDSKG